MDDSTKPIPKSNQSATEEGHETPTTENTHNRLHMSDLNTMNRNDQPETPHSSGPTQTGFDRDPGIPQQNLVQSTTTQSHGSDQHTPMPISEHRTVHTHGQGSNPARPPKDESTQIPSQEVLMITNNQGTQFPSQQWEQTPESKDQEDTQSETYMPERPVSHTSSQRPTVPGTHSSSPLQTSPAKTHTANIVNLYSSTDPRLAGTRESITPETESNKAKIVDSEHTTSDDCESDGKTDFNIPNEDHINSQHITTRTWTDTKGNGKPTTSRTTNPVDLGIHTVAKTPKPQNPTIQINYSSFGNDWIGQLFLKMKAWRSTMTLVGLRRGIVTLSTWLLVDEVPAHFLQPLCVLHLLEAHWWLCLWIKSTQV